jgi:hypothetical protein
MSAALLAWHGRRLAARAGRLLMASAALLALAGLIHGGITLPGARALAAQQAEQRQQREREALRYAVAAAGGAEQAAVAHALARLPAPDNQAVGAVVIALQGAASEHGLLLDKGSYQLLTDPGSPVRRYTLSLPLKGSYPALRAFVRQLRRTLPNVALDSVAIARVGAGDGVLEARLELSAFFRNPP